MFRHWIGETRRDLPFSGAASSPKAAAIGVMQRPAGMLELQQLDS